jgi:hypothetical protein
VSVVNFELTTTLSLSGSLTSLTDVQLAAVASSFAASLSVSSAQLQLALAPSTHRRSLLLQGVQLGVTVTGLGSDAAAVKQAGALLTSSATLSAMVARLASPEVTTASATPVSVTGQLEVKVAVPATMSPATVTATFSSSNAASLGAQLQTAGIPISGIVIHSGAPGVQPPGPPPTATPEAVKTNNNVAIAISISVFFLLLVCGASCYWSRRMRGARKVVAHKWVGKTFVKDEEEYEDAYESPSPPPPPPMRTRMPALMVPSADATPRRNMVVDHSGGRSINSAAGYVMSPIAETEAPAPERQLPAVLSPKGRNNMPRMPALMVPSADVTIRRETILDITAEERPVNLSPRGGPSSPVSPIGVAAQVQWPELRTTFEHTLARPHDAGGSAHGWRPALQVPSDAAATRRDIIFSAFSAGGAAASAPHGGLLPHTATYAPPTSFRAPHNAEPAAALVAAARHTVPPPFDVTLNLSGVTEEEEEEEDASDLLLTPSYGGAP